MVRAKSSLLAEKRHRQHCLLNQLRCHRAYNMHAEDTICICISDDFNKSRRVTQGAGSSISKKGKLPSFIEQHPLP